MNLPTVAPKSDEQIISSSEPPPRPKPKHMSLFVIKMVACVILLALSRVIIQNSQILDTQQLNNIEAVQSNTNVKSMAGGDGYWVPSDEFPPPYTFSQQVCNKTYLDKDDCIKANYCPSDLMNWVYMKGGKPYPRLNATGFLQKMKNKRIVFVGNSIMRQQILALMWTLGYDNIGWERPSVHKRKGKDCTAGRNCFTDEKHNITFCHQFMFESILGAVLPVLKDLLWAAAGMALTYLINKFQSNFQHI